MTTTPGRKAHPVCSVWPAVGFSTPDVKWSCVSVCGMCKVSTRPPVAHALHSGRRALFNPLWCQKPRLRRNSDQSATHVYAARVLAALPPRYHLLAHASTSLSRRYPHLLLSALSTSLRNPPSALSTYYPHSALSTSLRTIYLLPLSALSTSLRAIHLTGSLVNLPTSLAP